MSKYDHLTILKSSKQAVKISFFYVIDLVIIIAGVGIIFYLSKLLGLPTLYQIIWQIGTIIFSIFLCFKPSKYGGVNNLTLMMRLLKMDRETYKVQSYKH